MSDDAVDVELVEDGRPGSERRRVPVRGVVALLLVLVLSVGVALVVAKVHEAQRARELAARGFATSLTRPMAQAWSASGATPLLADQQQLVVATADGLESRDLVSGERVWALDLQGTCLPVVGGEAWVGIGVAAAGDDPARLWCRTGDGRDVSVDPGGGVVVGERPVTGTAVLATVLDGDVVRLQVTDDGRIDASRWSLDGVLRWEATTPDPVAATVMPIVMLESGGAYARVTGTRTLLLDLSTGQEVDPLVAAAGGTTERRTVSRSVPIPGGGDVEQRDGPGLLPQVVAVGPDGVEWWQSSGALVRPDRDDGSDPEVVLVQSGGVLLGVDVRTGERLWSYVEAVQPAVLVGGVVVAQGSGEILALRVADGGVLWRHEVGHELTGAALTSDGHVVVGDDGADLVAWGLLDGAERWRDQLPDGALWDGVLPDGALLVGAADSVTVLR
ncbi:PQQ-like beta-propeller repeat protein [Actinotalea sp. M2MS4P-6]|uniref:PQQ-like beta-propeller repeat protein n=1 Tax=Actinotalea sp. M2MS4P-6 TaxID=2983762 RepID=UPI0021E48232|nr:PQQ-like beta-propeller repeat protein [Actinotalea sp. M2MS4P-6]MCV2393889.1 PQQ-like beta-propeller repeat protein [Actinotalea sp. M2MS4P-6]